jgi:four helix bundle protein
MKSDNVVVDKSYRFALRIIKLYQYTVHVKKEYVLARQILRCGTSIGANVEEAVGGFSRREFAAKMSIAYRETRETKYWLRLLRDSQIIEPKPISSLLSDNEQLLKLIGTIVKTTRQKPLKERDV